MAEQHITKIGFVNPRAVTAGGLRMSELFPGVVMDHVPGWGLYSMDRGIGWHKAIRGGRDNYFREVPRLAQERGWEAVAIIGAPIELFNPGLYEGLVERLSIPVTTAMTSCSAAIKAFSAYRVLLITGFFEGLDEMLAGYYVHEGIELLWPDSKPFADYTTGSGMKPDEIFKYTKEALAKTSGVEAIYFQGALNNQPVITRIERELGLPVISSSLANQWYLLSRLGKTYKIEGAGRLIAEWPSL